MSSLCIKGEEYFKYLSERIGSNYSLENGFLKQSLKSLEEKVLDIGCGTGMFLEECKNSIGCDINKYLVSYCKKKGLNAIYCSIYSLPFKDGLFDGVLLFHVFEHLKYYERAIIEVRRVLKRGGMLIWFYQQKNHL